MLQISERATDPKYLAVSGRGFLVYRFLPLIADAFWQAPELRISIIYRFLQLGDDTPDTCKDIAVRLSSFRSPKSTGRRMQ